MSTLQRFEATIRAVGIAVRTRTPVLLEGEPGNAKTSIVETILDSTCAAHETCIAALHEPAHFGGYPVPSKTEGGDRYVALLPNRWVHELHAAQNGQSVGLFLDELSSAPPATRAAALRGVMESVWGEVRIDNLATVSAMNPPDSAEGGYQLSAALANRFVHIAWNPPAEWWDKQQIADFPPPPAPAALPQDWRARFLPRTKGWISGYCRSFPAHMQQCPDSADQRSGSWPSFRTWHWARDLLAACLALGEPLEGDVVAILIGGCVGPGLAREFLTYARDLDLPDPRDLLADPSRLVLPERADRAYAIMSSVAGAVMTDPTPERWIAGMRVFARAAQVAGKSDVAAAAVTVLIEQMPEAIRARLGDLKELDPFIELFQRAGLLQNR